MSFFYEQIEKKYGQAIGKHVRDETTRLEWEFQNKFDELGTITATAEQYEHLCHLEDMAKLKIKKRANWLWYLMKTGQYQTLDVEIGTDYTPRFAAIRRSPKKIKRVSSDPILFSRCNLPVDDDIHIEDLEIIDDYLEDEVSHIIHHLRETRAERRERRSPCFYRSKTEKDVFSSVDIPPCECRLTAPLDNRDYDKLSTIAINLRYVISTFEHARQVCVGKLKTFRLFSKSRTVEDVEMDMYKLQLGEELKFQGGGMETPINVDKYKHKLVKTSNRPKCCRFCPTIVCMQCFKGEGCCPHKVKYQGGVEQDVGGDTEVVQTSKAHNVVLTETERTQSDQTAMTNPGWSKLASSDTISSMDSLVNRWFRVGTFAWDKNYARNKEIVRLDLPRVAIFQDITTCEQPNQIPFRIHRYWRGNMVVKIHINCNKFQIGQLQCAWYYQPKADNSFNTKSDVFTRSGTHHCIISAAPNNEVELYIPFKAYKSMYHTKTFAGDEKDLPLDLGSLFITVLSPLKTTGETSPKCSFTVFVKLENNEFTGMMSGAIDPPARSDPLQYQMDAVGSLIQTAVPLVESLLTGSRNDNNRDNPPDNRPPNYFVPTASHSWAFGTDVSEPLHNLRLSARAQTCHPDSDLDEMKLDVLKRKSMLLDTFTWSQQSANASLLWSIPVNPIPPKDRIHQISAAGTNTLASYQLTPIGFLSSMYQYWRGSIEYRFDIVASQFHSGKLLLAYVPGIEEGATITLEQARASPNIVVSLDNAMSYTWRVPYVADTPWWPRRYAGESVSNNARSPSKIFVFVLNELVLAETVADELEILVYMCGGEDMEFSIPVQPSVGLGYDTKYIASRNNVNVFPVSPTDTYYSGDWHRTPLVQVMRRASTSEAVAQFSLPILDRPVYYELASNFPRAIYVATNAVNLRYYILLRPVYYPDYLAFPVVLIGTGSAAQERLDLIARTAFQNNYTYGPWVAQFINNTQVAGGFLAPDLVTTSNTYGGGANIPMTAVEVSPTIADEIEYQGNREESLALIDNTQMLASTARGYMLFGEAFVDLKDLCRRYQMYGLTTIPKTNIERDPGACSIIIPILPQGLELSLNDSTHVNQVWNRAREGHIPLIASLFRFYRGSLRIRMIVSGTGIEGLTAWVQHRPDRKLTRRDIVPCTSVSTAEAVFNHTYGVYMQALSVNNVIEVEVPFYQRANFGLLQKPQVDTQVEWNSYYSLGELSVGFFGPQPSTDVRCTIYYCISDDCRFTTFQGVPPLVIIDDLPEFQNGDSTYVHTHSCKSCKRSYSHEHFYKNQNHGQYDKQCPYKDCVNYFGLNKKDNYRNAKCEEIAYQGVFDYFKKPKEVGAQIAEGAMESMEPKVHEMMSSFVGSMQTSLGNAFESVKDHISSLDIQTKLAQIASQILHALHNPSATTIAISVISILITLGIVTWSVYNIIQKYIIEMWSWIEKKVSPNESPEGGEESAEEALSYENDVSADNAFTGFFSLICGGLCTLFGAKNDLQYKCPSDAIFKNIDKGMRLSNVCFVFFKNVLSVVADMKAWIVLKVYPGFSAAENLFASRDIIQKWIEYSHNLFDPLVAQNIKYSRDLQMQVLDCYTFGKILRAKALETQFPAVIQTIGTTFDKLHKLQTELVAQGIDAHVRKMPFVVYNYGSPEIGKSHLTTDLCSELCKAEDIKSETDLMCVLNATSKFWDNCDRQPCLVMDDAFNIRKGTMLEDQIAAIFNVVSPVVLVPPRAAVEDKGRTYNPEIFILNSNHSHFKTEVCLEEALWRRRDILIWSKLDTDYKKPGCVHCDQNLKVNSSLPPAAITQLADFHHLKFKYTFDVTNEQCSYLPADRYLKYPELLALLKDLFKKNRTAENLKFAKRVEHCNAVVGTREALVENMDNLERLWNEAIAERKLRHDKLTNTTITGIMKHFNNRVKQEYSDVKHKVIKMIHTTLKPNDNRYLLLNPSCAQCVQLKFQCAVCKMKNDLRMNIEYEPIPSTSSSSIEVIDDPKFENDDGQIVSFKARFDLNEEAQLWYSQLATQYPVDIVENFNIFLVANLTKVTQALRRYPLYARSKRVFMSVCESMPSCVHNISTNTPYLHEERLAFMNNQGLDSHDKIGDIICSQNCFMKIPWKLRETALECLQLYPANREQWMIPFVDHKASNPMFEDIWSRMVKYVYDFYYERMAPKVKVVFSLFSSVSGIIGILHFLTILFSCTALGIGVYVGLKEQKAVRPVDRYDPGKALYNSDGLVGYAQGNTYEAGAVRPTKLTKVKPKVPVRDSKMRYESAQQFNVIEERLGKAICSIVVTYTVDNFVKKTVSYGLMIRDQQMLIQHHYYDSWRRLDSTASFYFDDGKTRPTPFGIPLNNFFSLSVDWYSTPNSEYLDSNFGILYLPKVVPAFKDITKFIATTSDHEYIKSDAIYFYNAECQRAFHCNMHVEKDRTVSEGSQWLRLDECYSYQYTRKGLCGSVLLCATLERPIIGIHFAGTSVLGYSEPICQESFVVGEKSYDFPCHEMALEDESAARIEFDTMLYPQGTVPKQLAHHQGSVSQYVPSLIHGIMEVDTEPNPLSPKDPRLPDGVSPLKSGCEHMGKPPKDFEKGLLNRAAEDLTQMVLTKVKPIREKISKLSLQDATCGNINVPGFRPLEWSKSCGFPLNSIKPPGTRGKKWLFQLEETADGFKLLDMHGELKRQLHLCENLRKRGVRVPTIFTDCLKDTCIDKEKCKIAGKTRIFSMSPVQYTIAFKQYFNDFLASYQESRISSEHGIGMNENSLEWTRVAEYITTYGSNIIAGDYKNFGPGLMLSCVEKAFDAILAWYQRYDPDPERMLIRRVLLSEILHAKHLCLNLVYGVPSGIPSGSPITTPLNSLVNSLYLRCAWLSITGKPFSEMHDNIRILTYGDDVCINVSPNYVDIFNTLTLSRFFSRYDIVFTDIDKSDNIIPYRTLDNVTFLKRGFKKHPYLPSIYLASIEEQSIRKCVNWMTNKGDPKLNTLQNCLAACELAFGHGPEYYNMIREKLSHECVKRVGQTFNAPSWSERSEECYDI